MRQMTRLTNNRTACQEAVRLLSRRALSKKEIQNKLADKQYRDTEIREVVQYLEDRRFLDDRALSLRMFEYYANLGGHGLRYILHKIKLRGLPVDCLEEQITLWHAEGQEYRQALAFVRRKYSQEQRSTDRDKIARALAGKGFSSDAIIRVVNDLITDT